MNYEQYLDKIFKLYEDKKYLEVINYSTELLNKITNDNEKLITVLFMIGSCYSELDNSNQAIKYLKRAFELNSNDYNICFNIAFNLVNIEEYQQAYMYVNRALALNNENSKNEILNKFISLFENKIKNKLIK